MADEARVLRGQAFLAHPIPHGDVLVKAHMARIVGMLGAVRAVEADGVERALRGEALPGLFAPKPRVMRVEQRAAVLLDAVKEALRAAVHGGIGGDAQGIDAEGLKGRDLAKYDVAAQRIAFAGVSVRLEVRARMGAAVQVQRPAALHVRVAGQVHFEHLAVKMVGVRVRQEHVADPGKVEAELQLHGVQIGGEVDEHAVIDHRA